MPSSKLPISSRGGDFKSKEVVVVVESNPKNLDEDDEEEEVFEDAPMHQSLLPQTTTTTAASNSQRRKQRRQRKSIRDTPAGIDFYHRRQEWLRPYWLGGNLFLLLFAFWVLDSLKDPMFAHLVQGQLEFHQPRAKLCSVTITLLLVCLMEYLTTYRQRQKHHHHQQQQQQQETINNNQHEQNNILDPGGIWNRMPMDRSRLYFKRQKFNAQHHAMDDDTVSVSMFVQIGIPYAVAFGILAYCLHRFDKYQQQQQQQPLASKSEQEQEQEQNIIIMDETTWSVWWYVIAYALVATIESFGSITVATFWSYTNSTLNLNDAEKYYGAIIAIAQLGAIGGSTLVATNHWTSPILLVVVSLVIVLQLLMIQVYDRKFPPTSLLSQQQQQDDDDDFVGGGIHGNDDDDDDVASIWTWQDNNDTVTKPFWSGLFLIVRHYYVVLILGVSCLYEISMTCLDYQMKLLGYAKFETLPTTTFVEGGETTVIDEQMSFAQFMGRYGQVVNVVSLLFSSILFPWLIQRYGLRITVRIFPTLLLIATIIAYGALPGNLAVLFFSLAILKAMTYSVHDPSKEILYIPTSNAVKFRAKFWIDVVGERLSKAVGSTLNTLSGSVDRSVRIASLPSILSAAGLWFVCYYAGRAFDRLLRTGTIVGLEQSVDPATYRRIPHSESQHDRDYHDTHLADDDDYDNDNDDENRGSFSTVEIDFQEDGYDSVSEMDATHSEHPIQVGAAATPRSSSFSLSSPTGFLVEFPFTLNLWKK